MSIIAYLSLADFETSTFLSQDNVQYAHSLEPSSCPFFSVHSNSIAKVRNLFDTAKLFLYYFFQQAYFYENSTKKALKFATAEKDNASTFPIHDNPNAYTLKRLYKLKYTLPKGAVFAFHSKLLATTSPSRFLTTLLTRVHVFSTNYPKDYLLHTLLYIKRVILHFPRSTILSFPSLHDYECKSKKIIFIRQISKLVLYEMPF